MGRAYEVRKASIEKTGKAKAKLYSMYAKEIYSVAKSNPDIVSNEQLRRLVEKAKRDQIPADIINRNIDKVKKGITEDYSVLEYEAFGPAGSTLIIKCLTDNVNRTISDIKTVFNKTDAKLANVGSVSYMYEQLCVVAFKGKNDEEVMDILFSNNIDIKDIEVEDNLTIVYSEPQNLNSIKKVLEDTYPGIKFEIDEIGKYSKDQITLTGEDLEEFNKLITMLEELDDVNTIYHNVNL